MVLAREWRALTPEEREPYLEAAEAAEAAEGAAAAHRHRPCDLSRLGRLEEGDIAAGCPEWFVGRQGEHAAFGQLGFDFQTR